MEMYSALISLLLIIASVMADETAPGCKTVVSDLSKRQMNGITACTKSLKFKNAKDKSAKMTCILKCVMARENLLNAEGLIEKETVDSALQKIIQGPMLETVTTAFQACREQHAASLDPNEELCKTYDPLVKCILAAMANMCK